MNCLPSRSLTLIAACPSLPAARFCLPLFLAFASTLLQAQDRGNAVATYILPSGIQAVAYVDANHHIDQIFYTSNNQLQYNDLTVATNSSLPVWGSPLATYVLPNAVQAIAYIDTNQHVSQLFYQGGQWLWNDITVAVGAPVASPGTGLATYVLPSGVQAIAYIDQKQHVDQLFYQSNQWNLNDLTSTAGAPTAVTQSALATYVLPNAVQAIAYIDKTQHLDQVFYSSNRWQMNDLTVAANSPLAAFGSALATYVLPNAVQAVTYFDRQQHLDQVFYQNNQWLANDLTATVGAPLVAVNSSLATYVLPSGVQAIVFLDRNNKVDQVFYQSNQWNFNYLTPFSTPPPTSGTSLAAYVAANGMQAIAFLDNNNHLDELSYLGGTWNFTDLTAAVNAPAALTSLQLGASTPAKEYIYLNGQAIAIENP